MKRIISTLVMICIIVGSFCVAQAEQPDYSNDADTELVNAVTFLNAIGALRYEEAMPALYENVSRAKFAQYVSSALALFADINTGECYFSDTKDSWALPYINNLVALGAVNGDGSGAFRPEDFITASEALSILIKLCGYQVMA